MKGRGILIGGLVLLVGIAAGGGGYMLGKSTAKPAATAGQQPGAPAPVKEKNLYNGDELTLMEMYDSVQSASGEEFDRRLLVYLISIANNETGMLRQALTKAQHPELKEFAKLQMSQNDQALPLLNKWQSAWGYSDH